LGGRSARSRSKLTNTYGFGERTGLPTNWLSATNWTTDAPDYGSLSDEMYQAIPFFIGLRPEVGYGIFLTPPLEPTSVPNSLECGNGNAR